jgi:hypothetical protein
VSKNKVPRREAQTKRENKPVDPPSTSVWANFLTPLIVALASSIAGVIAYISTPLNEFVNGLVWQESAELVLVSQAPEVPVGQVLRMDIFLRNKSPASISEGVLTLKYPVELLRPSPETAPLLTAKSPKTNGIERLTPTPLEFIVDSAGDGDIVAQLQTKSSVFTQTLRIKTLPSGSQQFPTRKSFSGRWNIDLGGIHGFMELKEVARTITGEYHLNDGNGGQIEGTRDGKTFRANFYRGSAPSRFSVDGTFDPNPASDLEIRGKAKILVPTGDKVSPWKEDKMFDFNAVANAR